MPYKFKKDAFQKNRGGTSRVLDITCDHCEEHVTFYQKDGPGMLKRMYIDRFIDLKPKGETLICKHCQRELGKMITYKREDRPAYRLYAGAVHKKVISANTLP